MLSMKVSAFVKAVLDREGDKARELFEPVADPATDGKT